MSIPTVEEAGAFLASLKGRTTIFSFAERSTKIEASRFILKCGSTLRTKTAILDTDASYCAAVEAMSTGLGDDDFLEGTKILVPKDGPVIRSLVEILPPESDLFIIDGLNSLYSLASGKSESRKLLVFMRALSFHARTNGSWVLITIYRGESPTTVPGDRRRSLDSLADITVHSSFRGDDLVFTSRTDIGWPENEFVVTDYFDT